jgi:hypothetical protein
VPEDDSGGDPTFVNTIPHPQTQNKAHFAMMQDSARKCVERSFSVLQRRFGIIPGFVEYWKPEVLWKIIICCIIFESSEMVNLEGG